MALLLGTVAIGLAQSPNRPRVVAATDRDCRPSAEASPGESRRSVEIDGVRREYLLYVPKGYSGNPAPLVLNMHGGGGRAEIQRDLTKFNDAADKYGFLVAYPEGTRMLIGRGRTWNSGDCCGRAARRDVDDVAFLSGVIADVERDYCVDSRRIYATGLSNGAMMAYRLACELPDRIAAIATVGGTMQIDSCRPARPVSVMHLHGTADDRVPYEGGRNLFGEFTSVSETIEFWRTSNLCPKRPQITLKRGTVTCRSYLPCVAGTEVVLCTIEGAGHNWPGAVHVRQRGKVTDDISATEEISNFFLRHQLTE